MALYFISNINKRKKKLTDKKKLSALHHVREQSAYKHTTLFIRSFIFFNKTTKKKSLMKQYGGAFFNIDNFRYT